MEIPYTVQPRPDTGLPNPKLGIWLFLASEVMLFGALFSSYIFLRVGADFPWPFHDLVVWPGFVNTFVLIASSVTVVMAWASLKMGKYGAYKLYMAFTILCALLFMCLKSYEYYGKFTHYGMTLKDGTVLEGHVGHDAQGDKIIFGEVKSLTFDLEKSTADFQDFLVTKNEHKQPGDGHHLYEHAHDQKIPITYRSPSFGEAPGEVMTGDFSASWLKKHKKAWWAAQKEHNAKVRAVLADGGKAEDAGQPPQKLMVVQVDAPVLLAFDERDRLSHSETEVTFKDQVKAAGKLVTDAIEFIPDNIDLRRMKDFGKEMEKSMAWTYLPSLKDTFLKNLEKERQERVIEGVRPADDPDVTRYSHRLELVDYNMFHIPTGNKYGEISAIQVKREDKTFFSNFTPRYNPYYAIYFTMTGLHGLHVVGGALVLGYFLFTGRKMWEKNPQQLINRVEVGGLFWHFVDLVWIFLFPLYYLM